MERSVAGSLINKGKSRLTGDLSGVHPARGTLTLLSSLLRASVGNLPEQTKL